MKRWAFLCGMSLLLFAALGGFAAWIRTYDLGNEISLPLLTIVGVMALLGSLAVVAIAFSMMSMSDRTQALGLPNGSVRAVIALSLVVLFAILAVYLFSSLRDSSGVKIAACLTDADATAFRQKVPPAQFVTSTESETAPSGAACPNSGEQKRYSVYYRDLSSTESADFAKQLLVLIGTLVTSVSGFYFGSKATSDAQESAAGSDHPPTIRTAEPSSLPSGGGDPVSLTIFGSSLNSVRQVQLVAGDKTVSDGNVLSNPNQVKAHFVIPPTWSGRFDVIATDFLGRQARLPNAVEVSNTAAKPEQRSAPGGGKPVLSAVQPTTLKRGGTSTVRVAGSNLAGITGLTLKSPGGSVYAAAEGSLNSTETAVTADFIVPQTAQDGEYTLTATASSGEVAALKTQLRIAAEV